MKNIFAISVNDDKKIQSNDYYNPESLTIEERCIIPFIVERFYWAYDNIFSSTDYMVGKNILKIPRKIKSFLRLIKRSIFNGDK